MSLPRQPGIDDTRAFFREGYAYVGNRCRTLETDAFRTRIMLRHVVCIMGEDAARHFYGGVHFTRKGAMPSVTLRLLQDKGSVQSLDGDAHVSRKALFLDLLRGGAVREIGDLFANRWRAALPEWRGQKRIVLHDAMTRLLSETICTWAGAPAGPHVPPSLGRDNEFVAVDSKISCEDTSKILLRRTIWGAVVVGEIEVGHATIERSAQDGPPRFEHVVSAEVLPQTQADCRQPQPAAAGASIRHAAFIPERRGDVRAIKRHCCLLVNRCTAQPAKR